MEPVKRQQMIRIINEMEKNGEFAEKLGLVNVSRFCDILVIQNETDRRD